MKDPAKLFGRAIEQAQVGKACALKLTCQHALSEETWRLGMLQKTSNLGCQQSDETLRLTVTECCMFTCC